MDSMHSEPVTDEATMESASMLLVLGQYAEDLVENQPKLASDSDGVIESESKPNQPKMPWKTQVCQDGYGGLSAYLMHCENRRKVQQFSMLKYHNPAERPSKFPARSDVANKYLIIHQNCIHRAPVIHNTVRPGVPGIYTSIYFPQFNGVYRNAIGGILKSRGENLVEEVSLVKNRLEDVFSVKNVFVNFNVESKDEHILDDLRLWEEIADEWVTVRKGETRQTRRVI